MVISIANSGQVGFHFINCTTRNTIHAWREDWPTAKLKPHNLSSLQASRATNLQCRTCFYSPIISPLPIRLNADPPNQLPTLDTSQILEHAALELSDGRKSLPGNDQSRLSIKLQIIRGEESPATFRPLVAGGDPGPQIGSRKAVTIAKFALAEYQLFCHKGDHTGGTCAIKPLCWLATPLLNTAPNLNSARFSSLCT